MNKCVNTLLLIDIFSFEANKMAMVQSNKSVCNAEYQKRRRHAQAWAKPEKQTMRDAS